jgi:hypothetical protein
VVTIERLEPTRTGPRTDARSFGSERPQERRYALVR